MSKELRIGETVYWFPTTIVQGSKPAPSMIIDNFGGNLTLKIFHGPNELFRESVPHARDEKLLKLPAKVIQQTGVWLTPDEFYETREPKPAQAQKSATKPVVPVPTTKPAAT